MKVSPESQAWWLRHDVYARTEGYKKYKHPNVGELVFEYTVFLAEGTSDLRCVFYTPLPESNTLQKFQQLKRATLLQ